ncbi:hypothetical protein PY793_07475 [Acetobacter fabarum]|uniref:hypothetical protein n=1 Tax=Acetobacter fabarum TaxID=483199 RepID=UPI00312BB5EB
MGIKSTSGSNLSENAQEAPLSSLLAAITSRSTTSAGPGASGQGSGFAAVLKSMSAPATTTQATTTQPGNTSAASSIQQADTDQTDTTADDTSSQSSATPAQPGTHTVAGAKHTRVTASAQAGKASASNAATTAQTQPARGQKSQPDSRRDHDATVAADSADSAAATTSAATADAGQGTTVWSTAEMLLQMAMQGAATAQGAAPSVAGAQAGTDATTTGADSTQGGAAQAASPLLASVQGGTGQGAGALAPSGVLQGAVQAAADASGAQSLPSAAGQSGSVSLIAGLGVQPLSALPVGLASAVAQPATRAAGAGSASLSALGSTQATPVAQATVVQNVTASAASGAVMGTDSTGEHATAHAISLAAASAASQAASAQATATATGTVTDAARQVAFTLQQVAAAVSNVSVTRTAGSGAQAQDGVAGLSLTPDATSGLASGATTAMVALGGAVQEATRQNPSGFSDQSGNGAEAEGQAVLADGAASTSTLAQEAAQGGSSFASTLGSALLDGGRSPQAAPAQVAAFSASTTEDGATTGLFSLASADTGMSMTVMTADSTPVHVRVQGSDGVTTGVVLQSEDAATAHHLANTRHELVAALDAAGVNVGQIKIDVVSASDASNTASQQDNGSTAGGAFGGAGTSAGQGGNQPSGGNVWASRSQPAIQGLATDQAQVDGAVAPTTRSYDGRGVNITA